jgi:hypothetical protein
MKKNRLFILSSILIIISLFATAAACNLCGVPIEIGEATTEEVGARQQTTETTQGQSQSTQASIDGNNPPVIEEIELMGMDVEFAESEGYFDELPAPEAEGAELTFTIEATDEDGDELTYTAYDSLGENFDVVKIDNNNAEVTWILPVLNGSYALTIEVSDGRGGTDSHSIDMNFVLGPVEWGENNEPEVSGIAIVDFETNEPVEGSCTAGTDYWIGVQRIDPDGDETTIEWIVEGGEVTDPYITPTTWITPEEPGDYRIDVYVRDDRGAEVNRFIVITVQAP